MRVVIACAGTGGHINPGIAIANIIKEKEKDSSILFIGTKEGLENKLVTNAGYEIKHIRTGKIIRSLTLKNIKAMYNAYRGISDAKKILKEFKPDVIIGTGGYICVPVMFAGKALKVPYILHESNSYPGLSVKILSKNAALVMLGFEDAISRLKRKDNVVVTGTPAKFDKNRIRALDKERCKEELGLKDIDRKIVLVTCGSQGAKKINETVIEMLKSYQDEDIYYILVTGDKTYEEIRNLKESAEKEIGKKLDKYIRLEKFVYDMDKMYKIADLCITRSGAMTINELLISERKSILIPLPSAAENHQFYNAKVLENIGVGKIIEQKDIDGNKLHDALKGMIENEYRVNNNISKVIIDNVDEKIYNVVKNTLKK